MSLKYNPLIKMGLDRQKDKSGFINYHNTLAAISLTTDVWTELTNNGLGTETNKLFPPDGVTELIDVSTGYFDFTELKVGDAVVIRNDYEVTPNTNNALLELRYSLGTGIGSYELMKRVDRLDSGSGIAYRFTLGVDYIYLGDVNTQANSGILQLRLSTNGTVTNFGSVVQVIKR